MKVLRWFGEQLQPTQFLIVSMVLISAFAVLFNNYQSRQLFHELQVLQEQIGSLQVEWRQLLVEESAFSAHMRVEKSAREQLNMKAPEADDVVAVPVL